MKASDHQQYQTKIFVMHTSSSSKSKIMQSVIMAIYTFVTFCLCLTDSFNFVPTPSAGMSGAAMLHPQQRYPGPSTPARPSNILRHKAIEDSMTEPLVVVSAMDGQQPAQGGQHNKDIIGGDSSLSKQEQLEEKQNEERIRDVTFASPLLDFGYPPAVEEYESNALREKPLLLYLPGFDGTYICPFLQFPELGDDFDVKCMTISMKDRSTFEELKSDVVNFILDEVQRVEQDEESPETTTSTPKSTGWFSGWFRSFRPAEEEADGGPNGSSPSLPINGAGQSPTKAPRLSTRAVYIVGESFGGILASDVALTLLKNEPKLNLKGLALINAATCYDRSQLALKGPQVANLPAVLYPFGLMGLIPLFADEYSFDQLMLILQAKALPSVIDTPQREAYMGRVAFALPFKLQYMPQSTLSWRLTEWLETGCARLSNEGLSYPSSTSSTSSGANSRYDEISEDQKNSLEDFRSMFPSFRTVIVAGENDMTLPSIAEAERLANLLPNSHVHVVEGAGHSSTCGSRIDLAAVLRNRFSELATTEKLKKPSMKAKDVVNGKSVNGGANESTKRTSMKPVAAKGTGVYLGMEPRYDGADIGINPIRYWSKSLYKPLRTSSRPRNN